MSLVSDYYDLFVTKIGTVLDSGSGWTRFSNPYDISQNNEQFLRQGWAIAMGGSTNANALLCQMTINREFRVTIVREAVKMDHDVEAIAEVEKQLAEDLRSLVNAVEQDQALSEGSGNLRFVSDGGIQLFNGETAFLYLEATFNLYIVESITAT